MGKKLFALFFLLASVCSFASLTLHIQSPWRDDATKAGYVPHIIGGTTNYNAEFGSSSKTIMIDEGNGWFSYTWSKDVSAFQDWDNFEIAIYPNTSDNSYNSSHGEKWAEAGKVNIVSFFGSKMVWFKSPWGNKAVPDMILGRDTVMMRFQMDDKSKCGWFYGALSPEVMKRNPLQSAYFIRHLTPYMAVPEKGLVELRTYLASHDSIFVDGTVATPKITETIWWRKEWQDQSGYVYGYVQQGRVSLLVSLFFQSRNSGFGGVEFLVGTGQYQALWELARSCLLCR